MELTAVIRALEDIHSFPLWKTAEVSVTTDSQYVKNGITQWIHNWQRNGWVTSAGKPVKNQDLWRALYNLVSELLVTWHWVKGHAGNAYNEMCDSMVQQQINAMGG